ncbi:MAG: major capsid protein [Candidatus Cryptobacteroides sp.]
MNTNPVQFYDLLSRAFRGDTSSKRLQGFLDKTLAEKYNGLNVEGFSFDPDMQLEFTYEQVQKELGITAMANYYDLDSKPIPRGAEGASLLTGKIPRMKDVIYFNEDKVRKQLITEKLFGETSDEAVRSAKKKLFETLDDLIGGHTNSLTYQRHQMVSAGKLTLTDTNNPKGIKNVTFSASIPSGNKVNASTFRGNSDNSRKWWTDSTYATEGANADVCQDIIDWLQPILDKGIKGHLEVNAAFYRRILKHTSVLKTIALNLWPESNTDNPNLAAAKVLKESQRRTIFEDIIGVSVKPIDSLVAVEKYDKTKKKLEKPNINAFNSDVLVFVPDGNIGTILTVMPITFENPAATYGRFYDGRLLLTVEADAVNKCQGYFTEMTSLVVPESPQYMFYFFPIA